MPGKDLPHREEISKQGGILYDAEVVAACLRLLKEKNFNFS